MGAVGTVSRIRRVHGDTAPVPPGGESAETPGKSRVPGARRLVGLATVLATAVVVLAGLIVGSAVFAALDGIPGPDSGEVTAHVAGGLVALALRYGTRRVRLPLRVLLVAAVAVDLGLLLWFYWWA